MWASFRTRSIYYVCIWRARNRNQSRRKQNRSKGQIIYRKAIRRPLRVCAPNENFVRLNDARLRTRAQTDNTHVYYVYFSFIELFYLWTYTWTLSKRLGTQSITVQDVCTLYIRCARDDYRSKYWVFIKKLRPRNPRQTKRRRGFNITYYDYPRPARA